MQTQSDQVPRPDSEWAAHPKTPPRSVFGNYRPAALTAEPARAGPSPQQLAKPDQARELLGSPQDFGPSSADPGLSLQSAIDVAMARSFLYRFLAQAYQDPTEEGWARLTDTVWQKCFEAAVQTLAPSNAPLAAAAGALRSQLEGGLFEPFLTAYLAAFGHAARGRCPLNEIEYGDIKADPLFQPHRLADLAAFYRAFGLEVAEDADERQDHICLELEFMCVLAAKEAYALEHQLDGEALSLGRAAQKRFLREHLGRWTPAFARRLARMADDTPLGALADFTRAFVEAECGRYGLQPGSEDLLLRPVDEAAESLCGSCEASHLPPGALPPDAVRV
jgi:DMSO reductase family type II enzyme chaperone